MGDQKWEKRKNGTLSVLREILKVRPCSH